MALVCVRCRHRFNPHTDHWAEIIRKTAPTNGITSMWLCQNCHQSLLAWANIPPKSEEEWNAPVEEWRVKENARNVAEVLALQSRRQGKP